MNSSYLTPRSISLRYSSTLLSCVTSSFQSFTFNIHLCSCLGAQSCLTLFDPTDCSPPGLSVPRIFQARILEGVAIFFSRESSWPRNRTCISRISCNAGGFFTSEPLGKPHQHPLSNLYVLFYHLLALVAYIKSTSIIFIYFKIFRFLCGSFWNVTKIFL